MSWIGDRFEKHMGKAGRSDVESTWIFISLGHRGICTCHCPELPSMPKTRIQPKPPRDLHAKANPTN